MWLPSVERLHMHEDSGHAGYGLVDGTLDLPAEDVPSVQHWAEASVRSMDTDAGLTFATAREGQHAADQLRAYLEGKLALARRGEFTGLAWLRREQRRLSHVIARARGSRRD